MLDRTDKGLRDAGDLSEYMWKKYEVENYVCNYDAILGYVTGGLDKSDLFEGVEALDREIQIKQEIKKLQDAFKVINKPEPFSDDVKASDEFLSPLFENFSRSLGGAGSMSLRKKDFYKLVEYIPVEDIDNEVKEVLDKIAEVANASAT